MAYLHGYSRGPSVISGPLDYAAAQQYTSGAGFEVIPEEVGLTHAPSGVHLDGSQRQADSAFASWRCGKAPSLSLTSGLSLSTRSDVDLKEFLVQRGRHPLQSLHKAAAQGDHVAIMHIMKQLGPDAPLNELDTNDSTPLMYAVMADSRLAIEMLLNFSTRREQVDPEGRTAVHYAAFFGKHKSLKFLIDAASDWTPRDVYGRTPLHWACASRSTRCLTVLLKHAQTVLGDINPLDDERMTPLHCAAQYDRPRHIVVLGEAGCDFTAVDIEEKTALHWTIGNRDSSCVQALLDTYPPLLNRQDINGSTLLHLTAVSGATHLADTLLRLAGIDIDLKDNAERTPLHYCSEGGHTEIVQLLLTFGALDSCIDVQGFTALHYAVQSSSTASVHAFTLVANMSHLPDGNEGKNPLMIAAQNASEPIVKILLQSQSVLKTINHADNDGKTALHLACECGAEECVSLLVSYGADPNRQDNLLQTALMVACIAGHISCIHPLIAGGASSTIVDAEDHTPLFKAVVYGQSNAVQSLVLAGVNLNHQDSSGSTAVHMAAYYGDSVILSILLENGASPNLQDSYGLTASHMAAVEGHTHCVTVLVNHRVYLNITDLSDGRLTPLDYAVQNGHSECAEELKKHGAVTVATIREMAATCIQTIYRGFRARKLRAMLHLQTKAVTLLVAHVRTFLQKKRYRDMKKRYYAAIKIQAAFRGYRQRIIFRRKRDEVVEEERKWKMVEDFAQLVMREKKSFQPFSQEEPDGEAMTEEQKVKERQSRLEAAMKMRDIYKEKQKRWETFRAAEEQRRIDKARQAELNRLANIMAESKARREYTQSKFRQSLSVRSHHQAALVIQRTYHAMKSRRSWQERLQARKEMEKRRRENEAAVIIQRVWKRYRQYRIYKATQFRSIYTSPVVDVRTPTLCLAAQLQGQVPSFKKNISITGKPRRKIHQTNVGGFRVPKPIIHNLGYHRTLLQTSPFTAQNWQEMSNEIQMICPQKRDLAVHPMSTAAFPPRKTSKESLPKLSSRASTLPKTKTALVKPAPFHLPRILPN